MSSKFVGYVYDAASNKCINLNRDSLYLLVWDEHEHCRCYSTNTENLHFSVFELDGEHFNYSLPIEI